MVRPVKPRKRFTRQNKPDDEESDDDFLDTSSSSSSESPPPSIASKVSTPKKTPPRKSLPAGQRPGPLSSKRPPAQPARPVSTPSPAKTISKTKKSQPTAQKSRKYRPSAKVLQEIRAAQTADHLIPKRPFFSLVREISSQLSGRDFRYSLGSLMALQEAAENYITGLMEDSYLITLHAKRVTLMQRDIQLAYRIRGDHYRY